MTISFSKNLALTTMATFLLAASSCGCAKEKSLFPPEDAATIAKRKSSDNAFHLLNEAAKSALALREEHSGLDLSPLLGMMLGGAEEWETDEAELLAYPREGRPIVETVRQAFRKLYYLLPSADDPPTLSELRSYLQGVREISNLFTAQARICRYRNQGEADRALAIGIELVNLGVTVASDGPLECRDTGAAIQTDGCYVINESFEQCDDPDELERVLVELKSIDQKDSPWSSTVEWQFRWALRRSLGDITDGIAEPGLRRTLKSPGLLGKPRRLTRIQRRTIVEYVRDYRALYPKGCEEPYWLLEKGLPASPRDMFAGLALGFPDSSRFNQAMCKTFRSATLANIALRIWYLRHGHYPDTLDELVPGLLSDTPIEQATMTPMKYGKRGDSYRLYSISGRYHSLGGIVGALQSPIVASVGRVQLYALPLQGFHDVPPRP
jgi:hypothetical protein